MPDAKNWVKVWAASARSELGTFREEFGTFREQWDGFYQDWGTYREEIGLGGELGGGE